jgi:hypothetical protein
MAVTNLEKTDMVLLCGETPGHSELPRQTYSERFPERILPNARSWPPAEDGILVAEEIPHEIENQPLISTYSASYKSPGSFSVCGLAASSKRRSEQNRGILNRVRLSWAHRAESLHWKRWQTFCGTSLIFHFILLLTISRFTLLFKPLCYE